MNIDALVDELNSTAGWLKRTNNLHDAGRVQRAISALESLAAELRQERAEYWENEYNPYRIEQNSEGNET